MTGEIAKKYGLTSTGRQYCGCIKGEDQYGLFIDDLKAVGVMFSTLTSNYGKMENITFKTRQNFMDHTILRPYDGRPFQIMKCSYMVCAQGGYYRPTHQSPSDDRPVVKRRFSVRPTKKIGCQATMTVRIVRVFTGESYKAKSPSYKYRSWECRKITERLKQDMKKSPPVEVPIQLEYNVVLSGDDEHSHTHFTSKQNGIIHPRVRDEIHSYVDNNICSTKTVKLHLEEFVQRMFQDEDRPKPDKLNRCYYPTDEAIRFHIHKALFEVKKRRYDQDALGTCVNEWRRESPGDRFAFRPYAVPTGEGEGEETILFCHQTSWQRDLMARYGNSVSLLDATYKTDRYDLPLFFIVVKTNSGYCVAGTFLVQSESNQLLSEALTQFKTWNPDWNPRYFMSDHSDAEVSALEETFPDTTVYLCAFHRERSWHRWLMKTGNVPKHSVAPLMKFWRDIAASRTEEEYARNLNEMYDDKAYQKSPNAQQYFSCEWLPVHYRWVAAYQTREFVTEVNMNDGVETQGAHLKRTYLAHTKENTLTDLIRALMKFFLPDELRKYCVHNATVDEGAWLAEVPRFLIGRPVSFVEHVRERLERASEASPSDVNDMGEGVFYVRSEASVDEWYKVDFREPSCLCADFARWRLPCQHMCAVLVYTEWDFEHLPASYRENPLITLDADYTAVVATPGYCEEPSEEPSEEPEPSPEEPDEDERLRAEIRENINAMLSCSSSSDVTTEDLKRMHELSGEVAQAMRRLVAPPGDDHLAKRLKRD